MGGPFAFEDRGRPVHTARQTTRIIWWTGDCRAGSSLESRYMRTCEGEAGPRWIGRAPCKRESRTYAMTRYSLCAGARGRDARKNTMLSRLSFGKKEGPTKRPDPLRQICAASRETLSVRSLLTRRRRRHPRRRSHRPSHRHWYRRHLCHRRWWCRHRWGCRSRRWFRPLR